MIRKKIKIPSWDLGRDFMEQLSSILNLGIEEVDSSIRMTSEKLKITCFFDDRSFSFITIKIYDETLPDNIKEIIDEFEK